MFDDFFFNLFRFFFDKSIQFFFSFQVEQFKFIPKILVDEGRLPGERAGYGA